MTDWTWFDTVTLGGLGISIALVGALGFYLYEREVMKYEAKWLHHVRRIGIKQDSELHPTERRDWI